MNIKIYKFFLRIKYFFKYLPLRIRVLNFLIKNGLKLQFNIIRLQSQKNRLLYQKKRLDHIWDMMPYMKNRFTNIEMQDLKRMDKKILAMELNLKNLEISIINAGKKLRKMIKYLFYLPKE